MIEESIVIPFKYRRGTLRVSRNVVRSEEQIYTHCDLSGVWRSFHVATLKATIGLYPHLCELIEVELVREDAELIGRRGGVEPAHLMRLSSSAELDAPGIICRFPDDTDLVVDGSHRYVARFLRGYKSMDFWRLTETQCRSAMLELPPDMLAAIKRTMK